MMHNVTMHMIYMIADVFIIYTSILFTIWGEWFSSPPPFERWSGGSQAQEDLRAGQRLGDRGLPCARCVKVCGRLRGTVRLPEEVGVSEPDVRGSRSRLWATARWSTKVRVAP